MKKTNLIYTLVVLSISFLAKAQTLAGDYQGYLYPKYYIGKYEKGRYVLIDSLQLDAKGTFTKPLAPQIYTPNTSYVVVSELEYKEKKSIANPHPHVSIRFVYLGKDVGYRTSWRQETGYLTFLKGGEPSNQIMELTKRLEKTQALFSGMEQLLELLDEGDPLYRQVMDGYIEKATAYNSFCQGIATQYPKGSYMNVYALMYQQVMPQKGMSYKDFLPYRAKNMFMYTDLKNPLVANVPLLPAMYRSYLYLNQPQGMAMSDKIAKMQEDAKISFQKNAGKEVMEALGMQDLRPQIQILREKLTKDLNFDKLYKNEEAWFSEINEVLAAYDKSAPYHQLFGKDIITALERTQTPQAYTKLAEAAFSITTQFNWGEAQTEIIDYLTGKEDPRLLMGSGKIAKIFAAKNVQLGRNAPDLVISVNAGNADKLSAQKIILQSKDFAQDGFKKTLLIFYESDCGHCKELFRELPGRYEKLKSKGIDIIAVSADVDKSIFQEASAHFPWLRTYCDYEGISGTNFKNYAVAGTPTIFLIGKDGRIEAKPVNMKEIMDIVQ